jgi:hypothetical protein
MLHCRACRQEKERASERSIPGLMKALERGEMAAAAQPRGLTVTMRPYQLQSLQFMLDCEKGEGGFRRWGLAHALSSAAAPVL